MSGHKSDLSFDSNFEKDVPVDEVDVLDKDKEELITVRTDLYRDELYCIVPKGIDFDDGVYPQDQKLDSRYVYLWHNKRDLIRFSSDLWQFLKIKIPANLKHKYLLQSSTLPGVFRTNFIPKQFHIEIVDSVR